jgi:hypothetical protein
MTGILTKRSDAETPPRMNDRCKKSDDVYVADRLILFSGDPSSRCGNVKSNEDHRHHLNFCCRVRSILPTTGTSKLISEADPAGEINRFIFRRKRVRKEHLQKTNVAAAAEWVSKF